MTKTYGLFLVIPALLFIFAGCSTHSVPESPPPAKIFSPRQLKTVERLGYTIQVGAFSQVSNAGRLARSLQKKGLQPYYFRHTSGLYKVRFGNFSSLLDAEKRAKYLMREGIIADYYLVHPQSYAVAKKEQMGEEFFRDELIATAETFLGIPYKWGGTSTTQGFDCSGLTMAVYRLNGLNLPRTSRSQFRTGIEVKKQELKKGDLVFFATNGGKKISHVGIYSGNNTFIHAPSKGKKIQMTSLSNSYFRKRYMGARSYI